MGMQIAPGNFRCYRLRIPNFVYIRAIETCSFHVKFYGYPQCPTSVMGSVPIDKRIEFDKSETLELVSLYFIKSFQNYRFSISKTSMESCLEDSI